MTALIAFYWHGLLLAFGIGLLTGRWIWAGRPAAALVELGPDHELIDWPNNGWAPARDAPLAFASADEQDADAPEWSEAPPVDEEPVAAAPVANDVPSIAAPDEREEETPVDILGPIIAAAQPDGALDPGPLPSEPVPETLAEEAAAPEDAPDDLMMIKGIDTQIEALLRTLGVTGFADIAGWMPEDIERIDANLGTFKGRIIRDEWIGQARLLARGEMEIFNQRYGHLS